MTRSGGPGRLEEPGQTGPVLPGTSTPPPPHHSSSCCKPHSCVAAGGPQGSSDMRDDDSLFSRFFGGFK